MTISNLTNSETEKALIAALVNDGNTITEVAPIVSEAMFEDKALAFIYKSIIALYDMGTPIDIFTVSNQMIKSGAKKRESLSYLTEISLKAGSGSHATTWAKEIADRHIRRSCIKLSAEMVQKTNDDTLDIGEAIDYFNEEIDKILNFAKIEANNRIITDVANECITLLKERIESRKSGQKTGIPSGVEELDYILGGFKPKKLVVFAGRPGMGKTSVAIGFAKKAALMGYPSLIFSLEMPSEEIGDKLLLSECKVDAERYRDGFINKEEMSLLSEAKAKISKLSIRIDDTASLSIRKLKSKAILSKKKYGIKLIVIDYIQLLMGKDKSGNREQEIASISRGLKEIAKELDVTIIALSQLNRDVEKRADKIPMLSDLRESGAIEQDADIVMFAYRPAYYDMDAFPDDEAQTTKFVGRIIIAKHRGGSVGSVYFGHDKAMNRIGSKNLMYEQNELKEQNLQSPNAGFDGIGSIPF